MSAEGIPTELDGRDVFLHSASISMAVVKNERARKTRPPQRLPVREMAQGGPATARRCHSALLYVRGDKSTLSSFASVFRGSRAMD